jgi:hypothetical protein
MPCLPSVSSTSPSGSRTTLITAGNGTETAVDSFGFHQSARWATFNVFKDLIDFSLASQVIISFVGYLFNMVNRNWSPRVRVAATVRETKSLWDEISTRIIVIQSSAPNKGPQFYFCQYFDGLDTVSPRMSCRETNE